MHLSTSDQKKTGTPYPKHVALDFVWATNEHARFRAFSLWIIRSVAEKHRGSISIDSAADTIKINVPEEERAACALEIEEQIGAMCH